jgi:hypothetical protein
MRVVTTWMYFDSSEVRGERPFHRPRGRGEEPEPGIGVAWFGGDTTTLGEIDNLKIFRHLPGLRGEQPLTEELLRDCLDLFLIDAEEFEFSRPERSLKNPQIVEHIFTQPIVIERSPPVHVTLKGLLNSTNLPIWIGSYMGWSVAPEHSMFLFVTVPGGIIVVGSAAAIADALGAGLSKSMKRLFRSR